MCIMRVCGTWTNHDYNVDAGLIAREICDAVDQGRVLGRVADGRAGGRAHHWNLSGGGGVLPWSFECYCFL